MALFAYKAVQTDASAISGTVVADSVRQARDLLRDRGLSIQDVISLEAAAAGWLERLKHLPWRAGQTAKVLTFIRELATLLTVGVPLLQAIDTILKQHQGWFEQVLLRLRDHVASGLSLAEAMGQQPRVFDEYCVSIAEVGQNSGTLEVALKRLAVFKQKAAAFRSKISTALIYPAIVLTMAVGVSIFLMTFVVPRLLEGLVEAGRPVPTVTRLVKFGSELLVHRWWLLLVLALGITTAVALVLRSRAGGRMWSRLLLRTPILGEVLRKQAVARVATIVAELMRSGIVFLQALEIARNTTRNVIFRDALDHCRQAVQGGREIAESLAETKVFPPVVVQVFAVGQQSGRLEDMLDELAADYDQQVATASARLTAVLEPLLILIMVFVIGLIAFATVLPMLEAGHVL